MPARYVVIGQKIAPDKAARAREFRRNMTPAEDCLWQRLRANRLKGWHFRRQQVIAGYIVDFYCHAARLVVEVDGGIQAMLVEEDARRDQALQQLGLTLLRVRNEEVLDKLEDVLSKIAACLNQA
jgi:very-short-patch-repair endonuclease